MPGQCQVSGQPGPCRLRRFSRLNHPMNSKRLSELLSHHSNKGIRQMDKDRIKGSAQQLKGKVKEVAGKVTGDAKLETEGKAEKTEGKVRNAIGGAKDAIKGK
jgi:uncharacterized protein YjbJ (UPF0337 family)